MATPRKPRTRKAARKPANTMHIELIPAEPKRRRPARTPSTYVMEPGQPVQPIPRDADWVTTQVIDATIEELSKVSLADAATIIRAAIKWQPIDAAPVARLVVLGVLNLGLVVYDYLAPPSNPPPPCGKPSPISCRHCLG
jgi:hypothetical protein